MGITALVVGADSSTMVAYQLTRLLFIMLVFPYIARAIVALYAGRQITDDLLFQLLHPCHLSSRKMVFLSPQNPKRKTMIYDEIIYYKLNFLFWMRLKKGA